MVLRGSARDRKAVSRQRRTKRGGGGEFGGRPKKRGRARDAGTCGLTNTEKRQRASFRGKKDWSDNNGRSARSQEVLGLKKFLYRRRGQE